MSRSFVSLLFFFSVLICLSCSSPSPVVSSAYTCQNGCCGYAANCAPTQSCCDFNNNLCCDHDLGGSCSCSGASLAAGIVALIIILSIFFCLVMACGWRRYRYGYYWRAPVLVAVPQSQVVYQGQAQVIYQGQPQVVYAQPVQYAQQPTQYASQQPQYATQQPQQPVQYASQPQYQAAPAQYTAGPQVVPHATAPPAH